MSWGRKFSQDRVLSSCHIVSSKSLPKRVWFLTILRRSQCWCDQTSPLLTLPDLLRNKCPGLHCILANPPISQAQSGLELKWGRANVTWSSSARREAGKRVGKAGRPCLRNLIEALLPPHSSVSSHRTAYSSGETWFSVPRFSMRKTGMMTFVFHVFNVVWGFIY